MIVRAYLQKLVRVRTQFTQKEKLITKSIKIIFKTTSRRTWNVFKNQESYLAIPTYKVQTFPRPLNPSRKSLNVLVTSIKYLPRNSVKSRICEKSSVKLLGSHFTQANPKRLTISCSEGPHFQFGRTHLFLINEVRHLSPKRTSVPKYTV